ncbi:BglG family transcription antiterminator [Youngiibacter multivorans]|uniref:Lichenan operon transcriptional antiterminator n=1 Tax=Youngiibacter multivorans TaxID=937251 RepID=A0ABS4G7F9_9CLOT|nr:PTS sugar transporter subunit IIA [Youngiibacter multivorans]MBP1920471.1 lichenan operon transcriptional antiterminator [Youngiibacter multivorans]
MLSRRQVEILFELCNNPNVFYTASYFTEKQQASLRTIQSDITQIKDDLAEIKCLTFESLPRKGSRIIINDKKEFETYLGNLRLQMSNLSLNYQSERTKSILLFLLYQSRSLSLNMLADNFFISYSTLLNDLKKVSEMSSKYSLEILKANNKVIIDGSEINKRQCLLDMEIYSVPLISEQTNQEEQRVYNIKNILNDILLYYKYYLPDAELARSIYSLNIAIKRMQKGFYISSEDISITEDLGIEKSIAETLFDQLSKRFLIKATGNEIDFFALHLKGFGVDQSTSAISSEIDEFIYQALVKINSIFDIDLTDNLNLRASLALHCVPLIIRVKYNMQESEGMMEYIKQAYPLGYDIAAYFSSLIEAKYGSKVTDNETAFIAIYFFSALKELNEHKKNKKILIISSLKTSRTILLKQTITKWFANDISVLDFVNPGQMNLDLLDSYDIFLTTEKGEYFDKGLAMHINMVPSTQDYLNIKLAIDGFQNVDDIIRIFSNKLFVNLNSSNKNEILKELCGLANTYYNLDSLYNEVLIREDMRSTFFANNIALPHPMSSLSSDTFVVIGICKNPVDWDNDKNKVSLVLLVCIGKNNPQAFQLWNYLASLLADETLIEKIRKDSSFDGFISSVSDSLRSKLPAGDSY